MVIVSKNYCKFKKSFTINWKDCFKYWFILVIISNLTLEKAIIIIANSFIIIIIIIIYIKAYLSWFNFINQFMDYYLNWKYFINVRIILWKKTNYLIFKANFIKFNFNTVIFIDLKH